MAKFTPFPQSREYQQKVLSPEEKRDQQVIPLALGHLNSCLGAMEAASEAAKRSGYNSYNQHQEAISVPEGGDVTAMHDYLREKENAELESRRQVLVAHDIHGPYNYPAEEMTDEVRAFREYQKQQSYVSAIRPQAQPQPQGTPQSQDAEIIPFTNSLFDANPDIGNSTNRAA